MAGMPYSGKSYIVEKVKKEGMVVICPKDYRPDDYDKCDENEKRDLNIAAWECSLELLEEQIKTNKNDVIIIYDTCCASYENMEYYFKLARKMKHKIIYCYVHCPLDICEKRAENNWNKEMIDKYMVNFKISIPRLIKEANLVVKINNDGTSLDLNKIERHLHGPDRIHQSK
jgi:predicted kinase